MKPKTIRVEGFSAYRSAVEVDLSGVEFFSLSGATGSGKSSLVDAMVFALYGRVPRLGARAVAPAITAGADRARVAFDFEVGGADYTAVRLAERTKSGGASVKEARLQQGDTVLADGAADVTRAVEELLRLRFEDFTRTVVLPQGEFARFLTADKAERQALLRNLLGLDVYGAVRTLAKTRESVALDRAEVARAQMGALEVPDPKVLEATRARFGVLEPLAGEIVKTEKGLADLEASAGDSRKRVDQIEDALGRLGAVAPPDHLEELDSRAVAAREAVAVAESTHEAASVETTAIGEKISALPALPVVRGLIEAHGRLSEVEERLISLDDAKAREQLETSHLELAGAKEIARAADDALEQGRVSHAAHALRTTLTEGEACPVCAQNVVTLPGGTAPGELAGLAEAKQEAAVAVEKAMASVEVTRDSLTALESTRAEVEAQRKELAAELSEAQGLSDLAEMEASHLQLTSDLEAAEARLAQTEHDRRQAGARLEDLSEAVRSVGRDLMAARQAVADLEPPLPASDDVIVQWKELLEWRVVRRSELETSRDEAGEAAVSADASADRARSALENRLESAGVPRREPYSVEVTREVQVAKSVLADAEKAISEQARLTDLIAASTAEGAVAGSLAGHLKADGFERWMMAGAIADLVAGANERLGQLSSGGYSLRSDDAGAFSIVDHHNADEVRTVATLSGGETFLVSLALALSLAETLAARGEADLDAIIIDEGFGTLDDESLDTVASVLEDLSGGLMVGVITHVKELAGRAPVRFEVTREPTGSSVALVSS